MVEVQVRWFGFTPGKRKKVRIVKTNENSVLIERWDDKNERWSGMQEECSEDLLFDTQNLNPAGNR